jgi:OmpA-OmpF porin, OOP family
VQDSYLASLSAALPISAVQGIASHLGTSERTILDGVQSSISAVISGLSQRSNDKGFLGQILQLASATPENAVTSAVSNGSLINPASPFRTGSSQFLSSIFGGRLNSLIETLSSQTGLRTTAAATLLALGGQTVLGFLGGKIRDGSVDLNSLPGFLAKESDALKAMLPAGFQNQPIQPTTHKVDVNPVVAQSVQREERRSVLPWLLGLLVAALLLGFWWFRSHQQPVAVTQPETTAPVASTVTSSTGGDLGSLVDTTLPDSTTLHIPERGVEGKLLAFIKDPARTPDKTSWFDFDRLLFNTGSASLQPQSTEQLNNIAAILKAYPAVSLTIGGYTDNTGDAAQNVTLSQARADSVVDQLATMGIARDRLTAKGYGDEHPVADNSTAEGRALNRRISMLVTAK